MAERILCKRISQKKNFGCIRIDRRENVVNGKPSQEIIQDISFMKSIPFVGPVVEFDRSDHKKHYQSQGDKR